MLYLNDEFRESWEGKDPFAVAESMQGKVYRQVKSRKTIQFSMNGKSFFLKYHRGIGWKEIFKDLFQLRAPVTSAVNEWNAINRLHELNVDTMTVVAYGIKGNHPAKIKSFLITEDLDDTVSLEDYTADWLNAKPSVNLKRRLIDKVALIAKTLHSNGICHRDFYICHFHIHDKPDPEIRDSNLRLSLIDLHRALIKNNLHKKWVVKDVAGLYFSSMDIGLTQRDLLRFMRVYKNSNLRDTLTNDALFWSKVEEKAVKLYAKENHAGKK
jgi:heptose I phosphotransferase